MSLNSDRLQLFTVASVFIYGSANPFWSLPHVQRLTLGTFAGAYPLMYFAQELIAVQPAVIISAGIAMLIISVRTITIMGFNRGVIGAVVPAAATMILTLVAAVQPHLQGILLTGGAMAFFIAAMILIPRMRAIQPVFQSPQVV